MTQSEKVSSEEFYREYHGHLVRHLDKLLPALRASSDRLIWTAGDSSLDNKFWVPQKTAAVGAYQQVLEPPTSKMDVTFWLNQHCATGGERRRRTATINTAVEATTLNERSFRLRPQDIFLRENIQSEDILVVSVGGNDIALAPCPCTICSMAGVICLPQYCIDKAFSCGVVPCDDKCCGCGPSLCSCGCACPPCMGYFRHLFGTRTQHYIQGKESEMLSSICTIHSLYCVLHFLIHDIFGCSLDSKDQTSQDFSLYDLLSRPSK